MLPPGHIAAGFLTAKALLHFSHASLTAAQQNNLLWWGMFFGFIPDWDTFVTFAREKAFVVRNPEKNDHRNYISHAPVLWMIAGLLVYILASSEYWKMWGLLLWLGSWSHFLLDSIEYGIMWLWPFTKKRFALRESVSIKVNISTTGFFGYWLEFLKAYSKVVTFYIEFFVIILAIVIFLK